MIKNVITTAILSLSMFLTSCGGSSPLPKDPSALGVKTSGVLKLGFASASVAVQTLADVHATWTTALANTGDKDLMKKAVPIAKETAAAIEKANSALVAVEPYLRTGENAPEVKKQVLEAVKYAKVAVELLATMGRPLPNRALEALDYVDAVLGGGK